MSLHILVCIVVYYCIVGVHIIRYVLLSDVI